MDRIKAGTHVGPTEAWEVRNHSVWWNAMPSFVEGRKQMHLQVLEETNPSYWNTGAGGNP